MAFKERIDVQGVLIPLKAKEKSAVLKELVDFLSLTGKVANDSVILQALEEREALCSTGIGKGIAIPHAKTPEVQDLTVALGISPKGVEFGALDGEDSHLFFLLLAPPEQASLHVEALSEIAMLSQKADFVDRLVKASSPEEVMDCLLKD